MKPLAQKRARRELARLVALRERGNFRARVAAALRAMAGFGIGFAALVKTAVMPVAGKLALAAGLGAVLAFPLEVLAGMSVVMIMASLVVFVALLFDCVPVDAGCVSFRSGPESCDTRNKRRRKLDAMIAAREALISGSKRTNS